MGFTGYWVGRAVGYCSLSGLLWTLEDVVDTRAFVMDREFACAMKYVLY